MLPQLSAGNLSISSFGVFLALSFLLGVFLAWRLSRAWDLDEEKVLDLTLLTFLGGLLGARIYFILLNWPLFGTSLLKWMLIFKYPGLSFWGGFLGGWVCLWFFAKKLKFDFWQALDFASVGLLGGLILGNLGCFLGGCGVGIPSNLPLAVTMVGLIVKRFPVQILEALLIFLAFLKIWSFACHFHQRGKIVSLALIYLGIIKLVTAPLKDTSDGGFFYPLILVILGISIFYRVSKRNVLRDVKRSIIFLKTLVKDASKRKSILVSFKKNWYNQKVTILWHIRNLTKVLRRLNVRISHKDSRYY